MSEFDVPDPWWGAPLLLVVIAVGLALAWSVR